MTNFLITCIIASKMISARYNILNAKGEQLDWDNEVMYHMRTGYVLKVLYTAYIFKAIKYNCMLGCKRKILTVEISNLNNNGLQANAPGKIDVDYRKNELIESVYYRGYQLFISF